MSREILQQVKHHVLAIKDDKTEAILLVGSWAKEKQKPTSDIDIFMINKGQDVPIQRQKDEFLSKTLDIIIFSADHVNSLLSLQPRSFNDLDNISLLLTFLRDSEIWYKANSDIENYKLKAENWNWSSDHLKLLEFQSEIPIKKWAKFPYQENLKLIEYIKNRIKANIPVSHRMKDFPEIITSVPAVLVKNSYKKIVEICDDKNIGKNWTEMIDARKAIMNKDWTMAFASLKDVLKFLLRISIKDPPQELVDPSLWKIVENANLDNKFEEILEMCYTNPKQSKIKE